MERSGWVAALDDFGGAKETERDEDRANTKANQCSDRLVGYRLGQVRPGMERKERKADRGVHGKVGGCVRKTVLRKVWLAVVGPRCVFL